MQKQHFMPYLALRDIELYSSKSSQIVKRAIAKRTMSTVKYILKLILILLVND